MIAGTVPVYWGDHKHLRNLLPHPKAAIFVADFNFDNKKLSKYLNYLATNITAYEEHRNWRKNYNYEENVRNNPLLRDSWYCKTCQWAIDKMRLGSRN